MKRLYDLGGGVPRIGQATLENADENTNVTVAAAVSGKIIIPVWALVYPTGDINSETPVYILQKGGKLYARQLEFNPTTNGRFFHRFEFAALGGDMGTGAFTAKINVIDLYTYYVTLGYYLVDA